MRFGYFALLEVPDWTTDEDVLRTTLDVFRMCDDVGFESVHIAEHHVGEYVCSAPQLVLANIAAATKRVVIEQILRFQEESGEDYIWMRADTGGVPRDNVRRSLDLFAEKVMPAVAKEATWSTS